MKHTNDTAVCESCELKLKEAHGDIAAWFVDKVKPKFPDAHIAWSYRDKENQEQAFLEGKSKLHYPLSYHNKTDDAGNPCSLALDLFQIDVNGLGRWHWGYFKEISKLDPNIIWGGDWPALQDSDHFQMRLKEDHLV